jgi:hypothetical protein
LADDSALKLDQIRRLMALSQPLYLFSVEAAPPSQHGLAPVLLLSPVLFKTVFDSREQVVWGLRKTVFKLKLYDLIAFQLDEWIQTGRKDKDFHRGCRNIIPLAHVEPDVLKLFGHHPEEEDSCRLSEDFEKYSLKVEEYEGSVQEAMIKLEMKKAQYPKGMPQEENQMMQEFPESPCPRMIEMTQESIFNICQGLSQPIGVENIRSKSIEEHNISHSQPNSKPSMITFLGKHLRDQDLEIPSCIGRLTCVDEIVRPESIQSAQSNTSGYSSSTRRELQEAIAENAFWKDIRAKTKVALIKEHNDSRSRQLAERAYTYLRRERRSRMRLDDLCERITKNQPEMMGKRKPLSDRR